MTTGHLEEEQVLSLKRQIAKLKRHYEEEKVDNQDPAMSTLYRASTKTLERMEEELRKEEERDA